MKTVRPTFFENNSTQPPEPNLIPPTRYEVASLAYQLFEERGRWHGNDVEDWLAAEAHLFTD